MIRLAQYQIGDHVYAWSNRASSETGCWLSVSGKVIQDNGGATVIIELDKDSNFANEKTMEVGKCQLF